MYDGMTFLRTVSRPVFKFSSTVITENTWARRAPVQLMPSTLPSSENTQVATLERQSASTPPTTIQYRDNSPYDRPASQLGVELGIVGRKQTTDADVLGLQALLGARAFLWLPVYNTFTLKPSFGYFYKREKVGANLGLNTSCSSSFVCRGALLAAECRHGTPRDDGGSSPAPPPTKTLDRRCSSVNPEFLGAS